MHTVLWDSAGNSDSNEGVSYCSFSFCSVFSQNCLLVPLTSLIVA